MVQNQMTSSQLMLEARNLEKKELWDKDEKEMNEAIKKYVGKCYGSSKFRQKSKATYFSAIYIQKIERYKEHKFATSKDTIVCYYQSVYASKNVDWRIESANNLSFNVNNFTLNLNENVLHEVEKLIQGLKEIPYSTFHNILSAGEIGVQYIDKAFSGKLKMEIEKTVGDNMNQEKFVKSCNIAKLDLIDLEIYPELLKVIQYSKLPGFVEDRYLIENMAKLTLNTQIKLNIIEIEDWRNHIDIREKLKKDNQILENYIQKLKL